MILTFQNFIEELQEYISTNSDLSLNHDPDLGDVNFTIGDLLNISDLPDRLTAGSHVELTIYEDGGTTVPATRRVRQERTIRFLSGVPGMAESPRAWVFHYPSTELVRLLEVTIYVTPKGQIFRTDPHNLEQRLLGYHDPDPTQ